MVLIQGIVFDLDDTLYLEREYVKSGFRYVSQLLQKVTKVPGNKLFDFLWGLFEQGVRGNAFDRLLDAYPELSQHVQVEDLVRAYRAHTPTINCLPGTSELVHYLMDRGYRLGLLSDGPLESQQSKVEALGLETLFDPLVLTDTWGRQFWKPHRKGYEHIAEAWNFQPQRLLYIGDNPEKDFAAPKCLGWHTVRLRIKGQTRFAQEPPSPGYAPDDEISSLNEIRNILNAEGSLRGR